MDNFIAPELSGFTSAQIREVVARPWLPNFILNSMLRGSFHSPAREFAFNFFRRATIAVSEYEMAGAATDRYLAADEQLFTVYFQALHHWEQVLASTWHAWNTLRLLASEEKVFVRGDESVEERVNGIYNALKHAESEIDAGRVPPAGTLPVWLTNDGLRSLRTMLSYDEIADCLERLAAWAYVLEDPLTSRERAVERFGPDAVE